MDTQASRFLGSIPQNYDRGLGPHLFVDFAGDIAGRAAALRPRTVLELAAGTGIVTRKLRDALSDDCELVASDLNRPMLDAASTVEAFGTWQYAQAVCRPAGARVASKTVCCTRMT